jgi:GTPase SAR1 family protein
VERWMTQIETHAPSDVSRVLLATKCDLNFERQVAT